MITIRKNLSKISFLLAFQKFIFQWESLCPHLQPNIHFNTLPLGIQKKGAWVPLFLTYYSLGTLRKRDRSAGFRLGDREEQIFLPCSLGRDRGSSDPVAQRQRKATVEVKVGVHGLRRAESVPLEWTQFSHICNEPLGKFLKSLSLWTSVFSSTKWKSPSYSEGPL